MSLGVIASVVSYAALLLLPAILLFVASGRTPADLLGLIAEQQKELEDDKLKEDTADIDPELLQASVEQLRVGADLSLAYRQLRAIPLNIAQSPGADSITKVDLTECGVRCVLSRGPTGMKSFWSALHQPNFSLLYSLSPIGCSIFRFLQGSEQSFVLSGPRAAGAGQERPVVHRLVPTVAAPAHALV